MKKLVSLLLILGFCLSCSSQNEIYYQATAKNLNNYINAQIDDFLIDYKTQFDTIDEKNWIEIKTLFGQYKNLRIKEFVEEKIYNILTDEYDSLYQCFIMNFFDGDMYEYIGQFVEELRSNLEYIIKDKTRIDEDKLRSIKLSRKIRTKYFLDLFEKSIRDIDNDPEFKFPGRD